MSLSFRQFSTGRLTSQCAGTVSKADCALIGMNLEYSVFRHLFIGMSTLKAKRIGDLQQVINKNPHWAALAEYNHLRIQLPCGEEKSILLTDKELARALDRANKNTEDLPKVSWVRDLFD